MSTTTQAPSPALRSALLGALALLIAATAADAHRGGRGQRGGHDLDPQAAFERMDRNGDGRLTAADAPEGERGERHLQRLQRLDADGNGEVTLEELEQAKALRAERRAGGPGQGLKQFDTDGDGRLSLDEFRSKSRLFERADANGDGVVERSELPEGRRGRRAVRGFERLDQDGDGRVTRAEAESAASRRFEQLDADGDGFLAAEELAARRGRGGRAGGPKVGSGQPL